MGLYRTDDDGHYPATPLSDLWGHLTQQLFAANSHATLGVTALTPGAGTTTVAHNLAIASARDFGQLTLLLSADSPLTSRSTQTASLNEIGQRGIEWMDAIQPTSIPRLSVAAFQPRFPEWPAAMRENLFRAWELRFDRILLDLPVVNDAMSARGFPCRRVVMVVTPGTLTQASANAGRLTLQRAGVQTLGIILNRIS